MLMLTMLLLAVMPAACAVATMVLLFRRAEAQRGKDWFEARRVTWRMALPVLGLLGSAEVALGGWLSAQVFAPTWALVWVGIAVVAGVATGTAWLGWRLCRHGLGLRWAAAAMVVPFVVFGAAVFLGMLCVMLLAPRFGYRG